MKMVNKVQFKVPIAMCKQRFYFVYDVEIFKEAHTNNVVNLQISVVRYDKATLNKFLPIVIDSSESHEELLKFKIEELDRSVFQGALELLMMDLNADIYNRRYAYSVEEGLDKMPLYYSAYYPIKKIFSSIGITDLDPSLFDVNLAVMAQYANDEHVKKHMDRVSLFYSKAEMLTPEELTELHDFTLPFEKLTDRLWTYEYRLNILKKILLAYKEKTGMYFMISTLFNNGTDEIDKIALRYFSLVTSINSTLTLNIYSERLHDRLLHVAIDRYYDWYYYNKKAQEIWESNGKVIGYKFYDSATNSYIIRTADAKTAYFFDSHYYVKDYEIHSAVDYLIDKVQRKIKDDIKTNMIINKDDIKASIEI